MIFAIDKLGGIGLNSRVIHHKHIHLAGHYQESSQLVQARAQLMPGVFLVTCAQSITRYLHGKAQLFEDKPNAVHAAHALGVGGSAASKLKANVVFAQGFTAPAVKNGVVIAHA